MSRKAGSGLDTAGSADGQEERGLIEGRENAFEVEWGFAKPADVRANSAAAGAERKLGWRFVELRVLERRTGAGVAAAFEQFAMHVNDASGSGLLVEMIDVLGAEKKTIGERVFESGESEMRGIGFGFGSDAAAHGVKVPDQARVATPSVGRGHLFEAVVAPQAPGIAKCGDTTLGADAGTGQNEDAVGRRNRELAHRESRTTLRRECRVKNLVEPFGDDGVFARLEHPDADDDGIAAAGQAGTGGTAAGTWIQFDARSSLAHLEHDVGRGDFDAVLV